MLCSKVQTYINYIVIDANVYILHVVCIYVYSTTKLQGKIINFTVILIDNHYQTLKIKFKPIIDEKTHYNYRTTVLFVVLSFIPRILFNV